MPRISSDAINRIDHEPSTMRMEVEFANGRTYTFCGVPVVVFHQFLQAPSKGTFYNERIRGKYQC